mmetsp:Transcript_22087/g.65454  ORF Transcript_22087/g.65454 Transcript_22087/m.65454 type:complete len:365 (-) Transcript_22087:347-1441(-)
MSSTTRSPKCSMLRLEAQVKAVRRGSDGKTRRVWPTWEAAKSYAERRFCVSFDRLGGRPASACSGVCTSDGGLLRGSSGFCAAPGPSASAAAGSDTSEHESPPSFSLSFSASSSSSASLLMSIFESRADDHPSISLYGAGSITSSRTPDFASVGGRGRSNAALHSGRLHSASRLEAETPPSAPALVAASFSTDAAAAGAAATTGLDEHPAHVGPAQGSMAHSAPGGGPLVLVLILCRPDSSSTLRPEEESQSSTHGTNSATKRSASSTLALLARRLAAPVPVSALPLLLSSSSRIRRAFIPAQNSSAGRRLNCGSRAQGTTSRRREAAELDGDSFGGGDAQGGARNGLPGPSSPSEAADSRGSS